MEGGFILNDRFSDLRVLRWTDRINSIVKDKERLGPIRAGLDLTNLCNHACPWCEPLAYRESTIKESTHEHRKHTLETSTALAVLQDLGDMDCKTINFSGGGEPLLHQDFGTILRFAVRQGMRAWVVTNGQFIDKWKNDLQYAHHVRVSLDASGPAEHKEMHGTKTEGEYWHVLENIRKLCTTRSEINRPEVGIAYIVADCNSGSDSIHRILEFADEAGVDFLHFRPLSEDKPLKFTGDWAEISERIAGMALRYPKLNVYPLGKRGRDVFEQREFKSCYAALTTSVIGANGDVVACCDERGKIFGNVYEQSFRSIWLGARHRSKAAEIVPALCTRCLMCGTNRAIEKYVIENQALPELI